MQTTTCYRCCFAHLCGNGGGCEHYCSTLSIEDIDDTYFIEQEREDFRKEWIAYTESFCEE